MEIIKDLGNVKQGLQMIEKILSEHSADLPKGKTVKDFGGGYVEVLKTKANAVFYFGFDENKNRVSFKLEIERDEVLLWLEAMAETIWTKQAKRVKFGVKQPTKQSEICNDCHNKKSECTCEYNRR